MKLKRIGILVVAAAVLAVMTSGMASAATSTFSGEYVTTLASDGSIVKGYSSYGNIDISQGDYLCWYNGFRNMYADSVTAIIQQATTASGGLTFTSQSVTSYTVPRTPADSPGTVIDKDVTCSINSPYNSHTINAKHQYKNANGVVIGTSASHDGMTYY
jgi:hypothetical protein